MSSGAVHGLQKKASGASKAPTLPSLPGQAERVGSAGRCMPGHLRPCGWRYWCLEPSVACAFGQGRASARPSAALVLELRHPSPLLAACNDCSSLMYSGARLHSLPGCPPMHSLLSSLRHELALGLALAGVHLCSAGAAAASWLLQPAQASCTPQTLSAAHASLASCPAKRCHSRPSEALACSSETGPLQHGLLGHRDRQYNCCWRCRG